MRLLRRHCRRKSAKLILCSAIIATALCATAFGQEPGAQVTTPPEGPTSSAPQPALVRITSSFEVKHAGAVLKKVAKVFRAGFIRKDAESVAKDIDVLPAEQSRRWEFTVNYKGSSYPLQIRARLDDFGMLDLDFFCAASTAGPVREAVDGYLNSHAL